MNPDLQIEELAKLSLVEYDRRRQDVAKKMGCRVGTLDQQVKQERQRLSQESNDDCLFPDVIPHDDPVDGEEVCNEVLELLCTHLALPDHAAPALVLWIAHTYMMDSASASPLLSIQSPMKRCGKSSLLAILNELVHRPLAASNISPAALFRSVEKFRPTLLIDEADSFLAASEEMRGVLNSGHTRASAFVLRVDGDNLEPKRFSTWSAKALAGIGRLPDTLADRAIQIEMRRRTASERVERFQPDKMQPYLDGLRAKLLRWAMDSKAVLQDVDPAIPSGLNDREADSWRHLLAIADSLTLEWGKVARECAVAFAAKEDDSYAVRLLEDIRASFKSEGVDKITSTRLVECLVSIDDAPWSEWRRGKPMSTRQLAHQLKPYNVRPKAIRQGYNVAKGYELSQFIDPFSRYIPELSVTRLQPYKNNDLAVTDRLQHDPDVTGKNGSNSLNNNACNRVTDRKPVQGGVDGYTQEEEQTKDETRELARYEL